MLDLKALIEDLNFEFDKIADSRIHDLFPHYSAGQKHEILTAVRPFFLGAARAIAGRLASAQMPYKVVTHHGEGASIHNVVDPNETDQPFVVKGFRTYADAKLHCDKLNAPEPYPALIASGERYPQVIWRPCGPPPE